MFKIKVHFLLILMLFSLFSKDSPSQESIELNSDDTFSYYSFDHMEDAEKLNHFRDAAHENQNSNFELALKYINWGLKLSKEIDDKGMHASFWTQKGLLWRSKYEYDKALKAYLTAISFYEGSEEYSGKAYAYLNLGASINIDTLQLKYYKIAYKNFLKTDDTLGLGRALNNIGVVFLDDFNIYDSANLYFNKALEKFHQINNKEGEAAIYINFGELSLKQKEFDKSLEYMFKSLTLFREINNKDGIIHTLSNIGVVYIHMKKYDTSLSYLDSAEKIAEEISFDVKLAEIYQYRARVYDSLGQFPKAYHWKCLYSEKKEQINKLKNVDKVLVLEKEFEINKNIREIEILEKQKKTNHLIQAGSVLIIILICWISIIIYRKQKLRVEKMRTISMQSEKIRQTEKALMEAEIKNADIEKKLLEQEIELQSRKISNLASNVVNKIDFIDEIKNQIRNFKRIDNDKQASEVANNLLVTLHQNLELETDQQELKMLVEKNNQKFIRYLEIKYPEFSKGERQLLVFLKLGIPSKTIASILNISVSSVHTKRYRLRKKLDIKTEDSLLSFINELPS